jgi:hypothetical protein
MSFDINVNAHFVNVQCRVDEFTKLYVRDLVRGRISFTLIRLKHAVRCIVCKSFSISEISFLF